MAELNSKMTAVDIANFLGLEVQAIHKRLKARNLPSLKSQNRVYFGHETSKELMNLSFKKKVISFQIVKGGTGKTSLAYSFAVRANLYGARILCVDLDQQANLTHAFKFDASETPVMIDILKQGIPFSEGIRNIQPGLDLFPSRIENAILDNTLMVERHPLDRAYKKLFTSVANNYDYIILDCPPALGHSVAAATLASDLIISPVTPEQFGLSGLKITFDEINELNQQNSTNVQMKIVFNKFDSRTVLSNEVLRTLLNDKTFSNMLLSSVIRSSQEFPNSTFSGESIYTSLKNSSAKEDIDLLVKEVLGLEEIRETEKKIA